MKITENPPKVKTPPRLSRKAGTLRFLPYLVLIMISLVLLFFYRVSPRNNPERSTTQPTGLQTVAVTRPLPAGPIDFLTLLKSDEFSLLFLSVKDDAAASLTDEIRSYMKQMGSRAFDSLQIRGGYVAVIENGRVVAEDLNNTGVARLSYESFDLESAGYLYGNESQISFRGSNRSPDMIGINVVAVGSRDHFLEKFNFDFHNYSNPLTARFEKIKLPSEEHNFQIIVKDKEYLKLVEKRKAALKIGILLTSDDDFVPAKIRYANRTIEAKIRLKGDWVDHLRDKHKWSFRIDLEGDETLFGMTEFSIQDPATRNYIGEWIFHKALKREGIIGLRYSFINAELKLTGERDSLFYLGPYAVEESFDKRLIENNQRREGVIVKINENLIWSGTAQARQAGLKAGLGEYQLSNYSNVTILPFSQKEVLRDSSMSSMFKAARNLYYAFINNRVPIEDVFDVEKLAKYNAIVCLLGATHALELHNQRLYFNPVTTRFEPIGFDGSGGAPITAIRPYYGASGSIEYLKAFAEALETVSKPEYLDSLFSSLDGMDKNMELLNREFEGISFDKEVLYQNQRVIDKELHPSTSFHAFLFGMNNKSMSLRLRSICPFPIQILNISYKGSRVLSETEGEYILKPKGEQIVDFHLPEFYKNLFVSKKSKKVLFSTVDDLADIVVTYRTLGTSKMETTHILPWKERDANFYKENVYHLHKENFREFDFLIVDEANKKITFATSRITLARDLIFPKGYKIYGRESLILDLTKNAKIISYSPIVLTGSAEKPINILSSDNTGQGLLVIGAAEESVFEHVEISNLGNPQNPYWNVTGALNFYESPVNLNYVVIKKNRSEDALNVVRAHIDMRNVVFLDIYSDAFDGDFVEGTISHCHFENMGNDGIDVSGSRISVSNVKIFNAGDKGLSAGENSVMHATNIVVAKSEIGIASKDISTVVIDTIRIIQCHLGITAFQKKPEFGPAEIEIKNGSYENCETPDLIEDRSRLLFNNNLAETSARVVDRLYGVEYGKISE